MTFGGGPRASAGIGAGKRGAWIGATVGVVGAVLLGACAGELAARDVVGFDGGPTSSRAAAGSGSASATSGASTSASLGSPGSSPLSSSTTSESSSSSSAKSGASSASTVSACTPGAQQCASASAVETCGPEGRWGDVWTCATGVCNGGTCTGLTTTGTSCPEADDTSSGMPVAGVTNCGAGESCCVSLEIPGGTYYRLYANSGSGPTGEGAPASMSGFRLDKYLVTVGRFRQFVNAWNGGSGYWPAQGSGKHTHLNGGNGLVNGATELPDGAADGYETGWNATEWNNTTDVDPTTASLTTGCDATYATWTATSGTQENLPINCVNWYDAYAFCIWDGGFLPSNAEWEYAAAGGSEQREYPWGQAATEVGCLGTGYAICNCDYPSGSGGCTGVTNIAPVGTATLGAARWGQLDMSGEIFEWNLDWDAVRVVNSCTDCAYLEATTGRVVTGGSFSGGQLMPPDRASLPPSNRNVGFGLRCARTP